MSTLTPGPSAQPSAERQIQKVFSGDRSQAGPARAATGGCSCSCACEQCTFPHADGKSAVDTKVSGS